MAIINVLELAFGLSASHPPSWQRLTLLANAKGLGLDFERFEQAANFYHTSHYASANLIWQLRKRLSIGLEGLYGLKTAQSGLDSGDHWRIQLGMVYSLFD